MAVRTARQVIKAHLEKEDVDGSGLPETFDRDGGVFVTINTYPDRNLRGCIGYPEPVYSLKKALVDAAKSASTRDPRFPPLHTGELDKVVVEVSLLTEPEPVQVDDPKGYMEKIEVGRDGLIVEKDASRGLLLPQVPVEWGWDVHEFLDHTCMKAGLRADAWTEPATKIYSFRAQVFQETEPGGEVEEKPLVRKD